MEIGGLHVMTNLICMHVLLVPHLLFREMYIDRIQFSARLYYAHRMLQIEFYHYVFLKFNVFILNCIYHKFRFHFALSNDYQ